MPQTAKEKRVVSAEQYQGLIAPPPMLPSASEFFDYQVEGLVDRKLATYGDADPFRNRLPEKGFFLFVPPRPKVLDLNELMAHVELNGETGVNHLDIVDITATVEVPHSAHLLVDVEDGRARLNVNAMVSRQNIANEKRNPYDAFRGIIHVILFPMVLSHHCMYLVGSRCDGGLVGGRVPLLYLAGYTPVLNDFCEDSVVPVWGAPSAGSVIVP
ncbi:MAG TPA: DUF5701 family protein [Candidatus Paceibacterota bacterium]|nr:DUF5701 family protein [Candidatus Paceibacterota bacterium]